MRAQDVVLEVMSSLDLTIGDVLYGKLIGLYQFIYTRLIEANIRRKSQPIDDALKILVMMRGTWAEAIAKAAREAGGGAAVAAPVPGGGLSLEG